MPNLITVVKTTKVEKIDYYAGHAMKDLYPETAAQKVARDQRNMVLRGYDYDANFPIHFTTKEVLFNPRTDPKIKDAILLVR